MNIKCFLGIHDYAMAPVPKDAGIDAFGFRYCLRCNRTEFFGIRGVWKWVFSDKEMEVRRDEWEYHPYIIRSNKGP